MSWISNVELEYISSKTSAGAGIPIKEIPFNLIAKSASFWATVFTGFCSAIQVFVVITMMPKYLLDVHNYDLLSDGFISGIPFLACYTIGGIGCILAGF